MDPYAELGLARNATAAQVRAAYRKLSKAAHPDHGGDRAAFERLRLAHDILMDPVRRAKYDATGDISETTPDNSEVAVMTMLSQALDGALAVITKMGGEAAVHRTNLIKVMFAQIKAQRENLTKQRAQLLASRPAWAALERRIKAKTGKANRLGDIVRGRITAIDRAMEESIGVEKTMDQAIVALGDYTFDMDVSPQPMTITLSMLIDRGGIFGEVIP